MCIFLFQRGVLWDTRLAHCGIDRHTLQIELNECIDQRLLRNNSSALNTIIKAEGISKSIKCYQGVAQNSRCVMLQNMSCR